ncbi:penicillin-binding protein 2 [Veillonella sp.]|uniref:penicillin-binding protein 2 n=1 Tax=Veillonella sp. TaxID=1926307 RepID=UPI001B68CF41|nr:penicillin-binding protein 2 [Veillonella sp.]MBP8616065.1 penicillin-binding protein 2 [Veillonella sp.]MBP9517306.1 penicillin-binding protein 2 [Veillonella sp.]NCB95743.1 penicillin-binding protein 2 [Negativicutes bacterium]
MLESLYKKKKTGRFDVLFYLITLVFLILGARLFYLQIIEGGYYQAKAEGNRLRMVTMTAARGIMYDRNGQILVGSRPAYTVSIMPSGKDVAPEEVTKLAGYLNKPAAEIQKKISDNKDGYEPIRIATDVPMDVVTNIEEHSHELPGISIDVEPLRYYPYNTMASQLFGYVGEVSEEELAEIKQENPNTLVGAGTILGRSGLESMYDDVLRGVDGGKQLEVDATGRPVEEVERKNTIPGSDIHLTIDVNLQKAAEEAVRNQIDQLRAQGIPAQGAAVVALDPNTGAVLAMVSSPEFNPNWFSQGITTAQWNQLNNDKNHPFDNKVISGEYPPGSPFKIVTGVAALDLKKVTPEEQIFDSGRHWLIDKRNAEGEALGWLDFNTALAKSDNVYFYEMGNRVGIENIDKYAKYFGLGEKTGIKLYGEAAGNLASPEYKRKVFDQDWYLGETFDAAIGQSFTLVTPIQMAVLLSQVANGGIRYQPYVVSRVDNKDGTPAEIFGPKKLGVLPVPKNVMDLVRNGLRDVTAEGGTAGDIFKGFPISVAGKTGTAENAHGQDHGWFVAYAPYDKPRIVVVALVEQGSFGAGSAGPIVRDILAAFFNVQKAKLVNGSSNGTNRTNTTNSTRVIEENN